MATSDPFKRFLEAGTSFLDMTRERAEAMVKEWVDAGELGKGRAQKAVEQVLDRSRKASDDLRTMVRKEIGVQLAALGVATREDIARLEAKIDAAQAASTPSPPPSTGVSTGAAAAAASSAAETKKAVAKKAAPKRAAAKKAAKKAAKARGAAGSGPAPPGPNAPTEA